MNYQVFKHRVLRNQCRECINQSYGLKLARKDCQYWIYPETCSCCGKVCNIVIGIAPVNRWKVWLAKGQTSHSKKEKKT